MPVHPVPACLLVWAESLSDHNGRATEHTLGLPAIRPPPTQGFPDFHVLLGKPRTSSRLVRNPSLTQRFQVG